MLIEERILYDRNLPWEDSDSSVLDKLKYWRERDCQFKATGWPMLLRCGSWAPKKMSIVNKNRVVKKKHQFVGGMMSLVSDILNLRCQLNTQADMSIKWLGKQICKQRKAGM